MGAPSVICRAGCSGTIDVGFTDDHATRMPRSITIRARWDGEANVWIATSEDVHGLVVEADTWREMIKEVQLVLPDLLELLGHASTPLTLTFIAEEHLDLMPA